MAIRCQLRWAQMATSAETLAESACATLLVAKEAKPAPAPRVRPKPLTLLLAPSRRSQSRSGSKLEWWWMARRQTGEAATKTASETVEAAEAEATVQHMFACCLSEERDGQWQCNGGCGRNNGGRWFHVSCTRGGQHGDRASPLCKECVDEAMAGGHRPKRAKV